MLKPYFTPVILNLVSMRCCDINDNSVLMLFLNHCSNAGVNFTHYSNANVIIPLL